NGGMEVVHSGNPHVFGYLRMHASQTVLVICNFHETPQTVPVERLREHTAGRTATNLLRDETVSLDGDLVLDSYQAMWLKL
ncbi:MAG: alpha-glucosidase C-terminal domain-containing protein, partial [Myxococcota bacterium]